MAVNTGVAIVGVWDYIEVWENIFVFRNFLAGFVLTCHQAFEGILVGSY